jgi:sigma-B regulation protein RsbU (phosphoserine phosphatase)
MASVVDDFMHQQLLDRRHRLEHALIGSEPLARARRLLEDVDAALAKLEEGSFGICEVCHDTVEADRLMADPLVRVCLDHLTRQERNALEEDLQLAAQVQRGLLPRQDVVSAGYQVSYHYEPAGVVSGDYCDVVDAGEEGLYFMLGDVSGKGVAASMLMVHLHAMFRSLISVGMPLKCMLEHASRVFSESTLPTQYATLVCGRAQIDGRVEICNAGHPHPLLVRGGKVIAVEASGLPVGMFHDEEFPVAELRLDRGESLVLYSDGVSEATDAAGVEYGVERLRRLIGGSGEVGPAELIAACREDVAGFRNGAQTTDDVTMLVVGRLAA